MAGVFADIDLRAVTVIAVVARCLSQKPLRRLVVVLVHQFGLHLRQPVPRQLECRSLGGCTGRGDKRDLGVFGLERLGDDLVAIEERMIPVLIADPQILEIEGRGMAHLGAYATPRCVRCAVGKLDQVESVADHQIKAVERQILRRLAELTGQARGQDR